MMRAPWHMARVTCAAVFAACLAGTIVCSPAAASAAPLSPVNLPVGGVVNMPALGVTQVTVAPAGLAGAWADGDHVIVWGLQAGVATLTLTSPDGIEARWIQIAPAAALADSRDAGSCAGVVYASAPAATARVTGSPDEWQAFWGSPNTGGHLTAATTLSTPLQELGIASDAGVDVAWERWEVIADGIAGGLLYQLPLESGVRMAVGDTTLGPLGTSTVTDGDLSLSAEALFARTGQMVTAAQGYLSLGPLGVGYLVGPTGASPSLQYRSGSFALSAATWPDAGINVDASLSLPNGASLQGTWGQQTGWTANIVIPLDRAETPSLPSGAGGTGRQAQACQASTDATSR